MWIWIIIAVAVIGGIYGYLSSENGEKGENAFAGAVTGGVGCGIILMHIFVWGAGIMLLLWLFGSLFG